MLGGYTEWMDFWRKMSKETKEEVLKEFGACMHGREERRGNAPEEKMDLCQWLEQPGGFRLEAARVPVIVEFMD